MKRAFLAFTLAALSLTGLAACGFQPMYGKPAEADRQGVRRTLNDIYVEVIPNREGQYLRNALIDNFYVSGYPESARYTLRISPIEELRVDLDVTKTADTTRAQMRMRTVMQLFDRQAAAGADGKILERRLTAMTSYNILESQFQTRVSEQNAREDALNDIAGQIERNIALYFKRNPPAK